MSKREWDAAAKTYTPSLFLLFADVLQWLGDGQGSGPAYIPPNRSNTRSSVMRPSIWNSTTKLVELIDLWHVRALRCSSSSLHTHTERKRTRKGFFFSLFIYLIFSLFFFNPIGADGVLSISFSCLAAPGFIRDERIDTQHVSMERESRTVGQSLGYFIVITRSSDVKCCYPPSIRLLPGAGVDLMTPVRL